MNTSPWTNCDAYLFDIDGTLLNTKDGVHYRAFHHAVQAVFGVDARIDGLPVHGNTDVGILRAVLRREGLSDEQFEARLPLAIEHMCAEVLENAAAIHPDVCPSIRQLLEHLRRAGKLLGVASGNFEAIGWAKLRAAGLSEFFSFGSFSGPVELREDMLRLGIEAARQQLGPEAAVCAVGDTPADIYAARKNGIPVISVATGVFSMEKLSQLHPDVCVPCCTDLMPYFQ